METNVEKIYEHQEEAKKKENAERAQKLKEKAEKLGLDLTIDPETGDATLKFEKGSVVFGALDPIYEQMFGGRHCEIKED